MKKLTTTLLEVSNFLEYHDNYELNDKVIEVLNNLNYEVNTDISEERDRIVELEEKANQLFDELIAARDAVIEGKEKIAKLEERLKSYRWTVRERAELIDMVCSNHNTFGNRKAAIQHIKRLVTPLT